MPTCPICGSRHDSEGGVAQHMFMQDKSNPDGDHYHIESKSDAYQALSQDNDSDDGVTTADNDAQNDPEPDGGNNELDFPENPNATDDPEPETEPSRSRCPECGSGNFASSDLTLQNIPGLSERAKRALQEHEYHCHDCGEVFDL